MKIYKLIKEYTTKFNEWLELNPRNSADVVFAIYILQLWLFKYLIICKLYLLMKYLIDVQKTKWYVKKIIFYLIFYIKLILSNKFVYKTHNFDGLCILICYANKKQIVWSQMWYIFYLYIS